MNWLGRKTLTTKKPRTRAKFGWVGPDAIATQQMRDWRDIEFPVEKMHQYPDCGTMLSQIKPQRPDFVCFSGTEEILYPSLVMGADGGTIASSGVMPEVITKLYRDFLTGNHTECRRVQWMIQDLIATIFAAGNFPEGFRAAVSLRGFNPSPPHFPMSPGEEASLEEAKGRLACLLADCGYAEVARECELRRKPKASRQTNHQFDVESIVREVVRKLGPDSRTS